MLGTQKLPNANAVYSRIQGLKYLALPADHSCHVGEGHGLWGKIMYSIIIYIRMYIIYG